MCFIMKAFRNCFSIWNLKHLKRAATRPSVNCGLLRLFILCAFLLFIFIVMVNPKLQMSMNSCLNATLIECHSTVVLPQDVLSRKVQDDFQPVTNESTAFVYSAFYEERSYKIRVIGVTMDTKAKLFCLLGYKSLTAPTGNSISYTVQVVRAFIANINEEHGKQFTAAYFLCYFRDLTVPDTVSITNRYNTSSPLNILPVHRITESNIQKVHRINESNIQKVHRITESGTQKVHRMTESNIQKVHRINDSIIQKVHRINEANIRKVHRTTESNTKNTFTVCVSPMHSHFNDTLQLIEWVELNRILGVDKFIIYVHSVSVEVMKILRYYVSRGWVNMLPWKLADELCYPDEKLHYCGQLAALNDCLYRTKGNSQYITAFDLDEFIIPQIESDYTWFEFIKRLPHSSVYVFRNVFFFKDETIPLENKDDKLITTSWTLKEGFMRGPHDRAKVIARTDDLVTFGIHNVWALKRGEELTVNPQVAVLHHYRKSMVEYPEGVKLTKITTHATDKYFKDLIGNVSAAKAEIASFT